ncbi:TPA: nucleoside transporter [Salmonella enterica subsp. salamae serovar 9,46:z4,z24:z39:z42]|nr:nucleoside transporter [Salmonella enterica subsp. salamae serovar 9,46:z4,z24:z39:z42]
MKDGIYAVVFESHLHSFGEGIAVVSGGRVHGGDMGFTCRGRLRGEYLELDVMQYNRTIPSTLGMKGDYTLEMRGHEAGEGVYDFTGGVKGYPESRLTARAQYLGPLLEEETEV